jgi:Tat protein secretion system quality control protein TatD with DNase activity
MGNSRDEKPFPWHLGVYDAHSHATDTMASIASISKMKTRILTIMATRPEDQQLVAETADQLGPSSAILDDNTRVVPSFGWHPWFSHQLFDESDYAGRESLTEEEKYSHYQAVLSPKPDGLEFLRSLPDPRPLSPFLAQTRALLQKYPWALVGEVGLDKAFRLPETWILGQRETRDEALTPGGREGRKLSPHRVSMSHQRKVLEMQLRLAGEMQRPVSVHGVQAHGILFDTFRTLWQGHERKVLSNKDRKKLGMNRPGVADESYEEQAEGRHSKPFPPRICLHSYSGSPEAVQQYFHPSVPSEVFVSFSTVINFPTAAIAKAEEVIRWLPEDKILIESDIHTAGERMDELLEDVARKVCRVRGWSLEDGVRKLGENWKRFVLGDAAKGSSVARQ